MTQPSTSPILDRKGYLDGPLPDRVVIRENLQRLTEVIHERFRADFRRGIVMPNQERRKDALVSDHGDHLLRCRECQQLLVEAQAETPVYVHRDNTFADQTTSFDFEAVQLDPKWMMDKLNSLKWDEMKAAEGPDGPLAPTSREAAQLRGFIWDINQRPSRVWISNFRDDDTFHRRRNGNVIIVVSVPLGRKLVTQRDGEDNPITNRNGDLVKIWVDTDWYWAVVQCEEVTWMLQTVKDLRRFQARTGLRAKARKGYRRTVLTPLERLDHWYQDLDAARDDAWRWYRECDDLDDAAYRERPIFDPDVLYNARIESFPEAALPQIRGRVYVPKDDEEDF